MKWHIRQHLLYLTETHPSLQPKTAVFTHNDGRTVNLLQADGTVPMSFQGVTYNIPRKPSNPSPSPNLNPSYSGMNSSMGSTAARPAIPPREYSPAPAPPPPYGSGRMTEDPAEVFKKNAINKLVDVLNGDIRELKKSREEEMEGLFGAQATLRKREEELRKGENEGKLGSNEVNCVDVDEAFEPCDVLSKQMMDCTASDLAVEDAIYALDKAAQEGAIPFDQYLRNVRLLSREQFFHRATASKVRAVQMQAQVASMASRASTQYAF
ncbi:UNVERIFIED_CONTAM: protein ELC-like [Sesamum angustifolium]|uniref:Protein ELC-like n=1 Tax=Sesamum angustifolium TaxID=2727405 RepID=A0AAW2PUS5_9LAMI